MDKPKRVTRKQAEDAIRPKRGTLYDWCVENYRTLEPAISAQRHPSWTALADLAHKAGVSDDKGKPYSRQMLYGTWRRVQRDRAAAPILKSRLIPKQEPQANVQHTRSSISYGPKPKNNKNLWE